MPFRKWKVHIVLLCVDCDETWDNYLTGTRDASAHHKKTGHTITGEIGYAVKWES